MSSIVKGAPEVVTLTLDGSVAVIALDNPSNRNALSRSLVAQLAAHLDDCLQRSDVSVIVLAHTGTTFCAGADLKEARSGGVADSTFPDLMATLATAEKPTIARIDGAVRAGGIGLVAACDIVVSSERTTFAFPEVRLGVVAAVISSVVLPLMSPRGARELFLTGDQFDAYRAKAEGLVTEVVAGSKIGDVVDEYARALGKGGPNALASTKRLLLQQIGVDGVHEQITQMQALSAEFFNSEEGREGLSAMSEKRSPRWVALAGRRS